MQDFSTDFFILLEVLAGSYLVSKSFTTLCVIGITSLLAYMYHFVMCIMHSCRYYTVYILLHRRCFYEFRMSMMSIQCAYIFVFGRLYHINSESDMHILSIFSRKYHINSQFLSTLLHLSGTNTINFVTYRS